MPRVRSSRSQSLCWIGHSPDERLGGPTRYRAEFVLAQILLACRVTFATCVTIAPRRA